MSTATISPRSALDIHRQRHPCSPPSTPVPVDGPSEAAPTLPLTSIRIPSLGNIAEERSPRTTGSSLIQTLDGKHSDVESNPEKPARRRSLLIPGFRNQPPFMVWLRHSWLDVLTQLLCLLVAEMIYLFARPLMPRYFPLFPGVWTSPWGLAHGKPYLGEYINTKISAAVSFVVPFAVMGAVGLWWVRDFWESNAAVCVSSSCHAYSRPS